MFAWREQTDDYHENNVITMKRKNMRLISSFLIVVFITAICDGFQGPKFIQRARRRQQQPVVPLLHPRPSMVRRLAGSNDDNDEPSLASQKVRQVAALLTLQLTEAAMRTGALEKAMERHVEQDESASREEKVSESFANATDDENPIDGDLLDMDKTIEQIRAERRKVDTSRQESNVEQLELAGFPTDEEETTNAITNDAVGEDSTDGNVPGGIKDGSEKNQILHQKEGDRGVALTDEFLSDDPTVIATIEPDVVVEEKEAVLINKPENEIETLPTEESVSPAEAATTIPSDDSFSSTTNTTTVIEIPPDSSSKEILPAVVDDASTAISSSNTDEFISSSSTSPESSAKTSVLQKKEAVQNLVPPVPDAISSAFGRPLPTIQTNVPPLRQPVDISS